MVVLLDGEDSRIYKHAYGHFFEHPAMDKNCPVGASGTSGGAARVLARMKNESWSCSTHHSKTTNNTIPEMREALKKTAEWLSFLVDAIRTGLASSHPG